MTTLGKRMKCEVGISGRRDDGIKHVSVAGPLFSPHFSGRFPTNTK